MKLILAIFIGIFIFALIIAGIFFFQSLKKPGTLPSPTPQPTTIQPTTSSRPPINYDKDGMSELIRIMQERPTPIPSDATVREELIQISNGNRGIIHETSNIKMEYLSAPNTFEVQLKQYPINPGKEEAYNYLRLRGLTDEGICKLPLMFYLTPEVSSSLRANNDTFNPYPEFCQ